MISIIVPVYNGEKTLARALETVSIQSDPDWECIIVDNNSTDTSVSIAENFKVSDDRFVLSSCDEQGVSYARNVGLKLANGEFICFLDADDFLHRDSLKLRRSSLEQSASALGVCSDYYVLKGKNFRYKKKRTHKREILRQDLHIVNEIPMLTAMVRASAVQDIYFENRGHEDYVFWLNVLSRGYMLNLDLVTATYDATISGLSSNKIQATGWHYSIMRTVLKLGRLRSGLHTLIFILVQLKRSLL